VAVFFLRQTPVESRVEAGALEWEYLRAVASTRAGPEPLPPLLAAEAVNPPEELRAVEKPQPLPSELLKLHQLPSKNTIAVVAGK
jgi:hypothetical protein